jgi:hypothetical protein
MMRKIIKREVICLLNKYRLMNVRKVKGSVMKINDGFYVFVYIVTKLNEIELNYYNENQ